VRIPPRSRIGRSLGEAGHRAAGKRRKTGTGVAGTSRARTAAGSDFRSRFRYLTVRFRQQLMQPLPVERWPRIGLAAWGDIGMADQPVGPNRRISDPQRRDDCRQMQILAVVVGQLVGAFQFDSDAEIVAAMAAGVNRFASVPSPAMKRYVLHHFAVPADEQMRRYPHPGDLLEIRMCGRIERIGEQRVDPRSAKFAGRQADAVDDDQIHRRAGRPVVAVGRGSILGRVQQPCRRIDPHRRLQNHVLEVVAHVGMWALQEKTLHIIDAARPQYRQDRSILDSR